MPRKGEQSGMPQAYLMFSECYNECCTNVDITLQFRPTASILTRFFNLPDQLDVKAIFQNYCQTVISTPKERFDKP